MFEEEGARPWLEGLNGRQVEAVTAAPGHVLVVAGAGSGKTRTLAARVAHLVAGGTPPERILLLTFTRRAAREMLARARRWCGDGAAGRVWGGTFHATANRLLRLAGRPIGISPDFTILDQADAADLMDLIRSDLGLGTGERRFPRKDTLAAIYSRTVNAGLSLGSVLEHAFPWCRGAHEGIRDVFVRYTERKRSRNVLDYDDLLLHWNALARTPGGGERLAGLFDHLLVDEYQDTNALQADVLEAMAAGGAHVMVVGDDAQAIYGFRSATVRNILEFPSRFPGARMIALERNYRSTGPIVDASNAVIGLSPERHEKTMTTERRSAVRPVLTTCLDEADQSDLVCRAVLEHRERGVPLRRQAVLFRAAHHSDLLEVELARRNIPFVKYGGLKFLEAAHVKDALALLRILENPTDEVSWFRVLQLLDGVGPATARRLVRELWPDPVERLLRGPPAVPPPAAEGVAGLRTALSDCLDATMPVPAQLERLIRWLEPVVARRYESPRERLRDLEMLGALAGPAASRARFLADLTLDPPVSTGDLAGPPLLDEDYLVLSTIHSAKGLEWDVVHVLHVADGSIPSDMATGRPEEIEEERRLLYVAMTRARNVLSLSFPLRAYHGPRFAVHDRHSYTQLSRFLPASVLGLFDTRSTAAVEERPDPEMSDRPGAEGRARVDAYLSGLWT